MYGSEENLRLLIIALTGKACSKAAVLSLRATQSDLYFTGRKQTLNMACVTLLVNSC